MITFEIFFPPPPICITTENDDEDGYVYFLRFLSSAVCLFFSHFLVCGRSLSLSRVKQSRIFFSHLANIRVEEKETGCTRTLSQMICYCYRFFLLLSQSIGSIPMNNSRRLFFSFASDNATNTCNEQKGPRRSYRPMTYFRVFLSRIRGLGIDLDENKNWIKSRYKIDNGCSAALGIFIDAKDHVSYGRTCAALAIVQGAGSFNEDATRSPGKDYPSIDDCLLLMISYLRSTSLSKKL